MSKDFNYAKCVILTAAALVVIVILYNMCLNNKQLKTESQGVKTMGEPITIQTVHEKLVNLHDGLEERYRQEAERYSKLDAKFDVVFQSAKESAWTPVIVLAAFVIAGAIGYHLRGLVG